MFLTSEKALQVLLGTRLKTNCECVGSCVLFYTFLGRGSLLILPPLLGNSGATVVSFSPLRQGASFILNFSSLLAQRIIRPLLGSTLSIFISIYEKMAIFPLLLIISLTRKKMRACHWVWGHPFLGHQKCGHGVNP